MQFWIQNSNILPHHKQPLIQVFIGLMQLQYIKFPVLVLQIYYFTIHVQLYTQLNYLCLRLQVFKQGRIFSCLEQVSAAHFLNLQNVEIAFNLKEVINQNAHKLIIIQSHVFGLRRTRTSQP
ncbi:unnamed protein product [Paramecium octaurelia]|uniref:Uncharacterized protein n=1 Tax=Paramecium octaurelia TaxID=43137 RepID=A0A8S1W4Y7_PAROT|nr:unnamed protein product [Paramecium octaurelia]